MKKLLWPLMFLIISIPVISFAEVKIQEETVIQFRAKDIKDIWYLGMRLCKTENFDDCFKWNVIPRKFDTKQQAFDFADTMMKNMNNEKNDIRITKYPK